MKLTRFLLIALTMGALVPLSAQELPVIEHKRVTCLLAEARPLLEAVLHVEGLPRVYYREVGSDRWCYVDGDRYEDEGVVALPEFAKGTRVEYFFITYTEERITGRSPVTYRVPVTERCATQAARHTGAIVPECEGLGAIPWAFEPTAVFQDVEISPSSPEQ